VIETDNDSRGKTDNDSRGETDSKSITVIVVLKWH
jgi:hypothetical protein